MASIPARAAVSAAAVAFMLWGPLADLCGAGVSRLSRPWRMYAGVGLEMCAVDFRAARPDGTSERIDRYRALGLAGRSAAPADLRYIGSDTSARRWARALCERLGPAADVRVIMRCPGEDGGWEIQLRGDHNECSAREEEAVAEEIAERDADADGDGEEQR